MLFLRDDLLYTPTKEVQDFNDCFRKALKVIGWLSNKKAYAVSFNQLNLIERCFVVKKPKKIKFPIDIVMNPKFERRDDSKEIVSEEACLSFPRQLFKIKRYDKIFAQYYDYYEKSIKYIELDGISAIMFQHECSHLDGKPDDIICIKDKEKKK